MLAPPVDHVVEASYSSSPVPSIYQTLGDRHCLLSFPNLPDARIYASEETQLFMLIDDLKAFPRLLLADFFE
jgi:hypothetical protein